MRFISKIKWLMLGALVATGTLLSCEQKKSPVEMADIFVGTSNSRWMLGPYASVPYGMVQLGPDNQDGEWMCGYEYSFASVRGFSHIHAYAYSGLLIMPTAQDFTKDGGTVSSAYRGAGSGYHSRILKETEKGTPGYYSCELYDSACRAELTATTHCGVHKYTFQKKDLVRIMLSSLVPAEYTPSVSKAEFKKTDDKTVEGYAAMNGIYGAYTVYFSIQFNKPFKSFNGWAENDVRHNVEEISGQKDVGAFVTYSPEDGEEIMLKVGLSVVDMDGARNNLKQELGSFGWDFDAIVKSAQQQWADRLNTIEVEGSEENRKKFYTNFYRSICKQTWSDADGRYTDTYGKIQQLPANGKMFGGDSFWNSYWNYNSLFSLVATDYLNGWVQTQLELFDKTGWTSVGPSGLKMTGIMNVTHEIALMVSAYQKGIRDYDVNKLYDAVSHNSKEQGKRIDYGVGAGLSGMERLDTYDKLGYVPSDLDAASRTLDYAYTDYCAGQLAKAFGKTEDYDKFIKRSSNWKNQFHPDLKYQVPKNSKGEWKENYSQFSGDHWIEGNGWQYSFYVPHDIKGVIALTGQDLFNQRLEEGFAKSVKHDFAAHAFDRHQTEAFEYYINHGNEPNMQASFLFNYSGKPWLTQKYSRAILDQYYGNTPYNGWGGDEDEGQMGAWFVIASMGLFEMNGGVTDSPEFDLSSPLFDKVTIHIDKRYNGGKPFVIKSKNNSKENVYIQSASLNGVPLTKPKLSFKDVVKGGELILEMGDKPNYQWGVE